MSGQKPRQIAARVLRQHADGAEFIENLLDPALAEARLAPPDRSLCQELVYGVVRWRATLDWLIARKTPGRVQKPALQELLRLGLYQIFWLDRIPGHAAVNETVELAKQNGYGQQAGFINAVLRGYLREADATRQLLTELKSAQPHLGWSHPEWLVEKWRKRFAGGWSLRDEPARQPNRSAAVPAAAAANSAGDSGDSDACRAAELLRLEPPRSDGSGPAHPAVSDSDPVARLLEWNNRPPKNFARVNTLKTDAGRLLDRWRMEENVEYDFVRRDWLDESQVFELKAHPPLMSLGSFRDGWFYVQDPSTLLAVRALDPQPGETVLDSCAAPGGKTAFIAQLMRNEGRIVAQDVSEDRLKLVKENCDRLGVTCVEARVGVQASACAPDTLKRELQLFARVLVDAPCSNTGVMRRRVDLRWRLRPEEIERLRKSQLALLRQAATQVKPGGVLIYSTCSLEPEENQEVVKQFLAEHAGFTLERERELLPFVDGVDGAFVAALVKAR